jgi:hypothetical protein
LLAVVEEMGEDVAFFDLVAFVDFDVLDDVLEDGGADGDFLEREDEAGGFLGLGEEGGGQEEEEEGGEF